MSLINKASLILTPNAVKESKLYSIIPSNGNGDLTFTRGTLASSTLNNVSGLIESVPYNLLKYSEDLANVGTWGTIDTTVTANAEVSPNGTLTADTLTMSTNSSRVSQGLTLGAGTYTISVWAKSITGAGILRQLVTTDVGNISFQFTPTNEWVRYEATFSVASFFNGYQLRSVNYVGVVSFWGAQVVQGSIPKDYFFTTDRLNVPRLNYDSVGGCPSILLEPQRTNLLLNSVWAGGAIPTSWSQFTTGGTLTPIASIKNPNVTAFNFSGTASRNFISQTRAFTNGYIYAISFYVESVTTTAFLDTIIGTSVVTGYSTYLKNNVAVNGSTEAIAAGNTYTLVYTATSTSATATVRIGLGTNGNSTANFTISMPQMEIGASNIASYSTSYIPTTTASVTRNADVFSRNNIYTNGLITNAGGTWFIELNDNILYTADNNAGIIFLDTSSVGFTNGLHIRKLQTNTLRFVIQKVISTAATTLYITSTDVVKIALKWNGTIVDVFVNGVKISVASPSFTATNMEFLSNNLNPLKANIKSTMLFPTPLTDLECTQLTTL